MRINYAEDQTDDVIEHYNWKGDLCELNADGDLGKCSHLLLSIHTQYHFKGRHTDLFAQVNRKWKPAKQPKVLEHLWLWASVCLQWSSCNKTYCIKMKCIAQVVWFESFE